jgi:hypothetical protein
MGLRELPLVLACAAGLALGAARPAGAGEPDQPAPEDRDYTDGYVPVAAEVCHVQTFKAPATEISGVRLRCARAGQVPEDDLTVEIREPGKAEPLVKGLIPVEWDQGPKIKDQVVVRYYQWFSVKNIKVHGLVKGKTYELVLSSPKSFEELPWLLNCFYRDTYPDGQCRREVNGKSSPVAGGKYDLIFEISGEGEQISSVPRGLELPAKEHFGLGPDGKDLLEGWDLKRPERLRRRWPAADAGGAPVARVEPPPPPPPADPPAMTREQALAAAAKDGKVLWSQADPEDPRLLWIAVEGRLLCLFDAQAGTLSGSADYLKAIGREKLTASGAAFGKQSVWVATDRGALVYDRKTRGWSQCVINLDMDLLDAPVEKVWLTPAGVAFKVKDRGAFEFDAAERKWRKL